MQKVERLLAITLLLQTRGKMTAQRLASILDVSVRTIYRDMDALSLAHVPVSMDYGPGGGYFLPDAYRLEQARFTGDEAAALAMGGAIAGGSQLLARDEELQRALLKLEAALPEEFRQDVRAARERILFDGTAWYDQPEALAHLETVRAAVWSARQLDLLYPRSDGCGSQWRRVEPHGLVYKAGSWYLVAFCGLRQDFRIFRVSRVEAAEKRDEEVTPRSGFDLETYWADARQRLQERSLPFALTLRLGAAALARVGSTGTVLRQEADDATVVQVNVESADAALRYVLALGADVTVLDPPEIGRRVAETARRIAERHEDQLTRQQR